MKVSSFARAKTVLVTGGAGFIGSRIVRYLVKVGDNVRVLDNFSNAPRDSLADIESRITLFHGDIRDKQLVAKAMQGVDVVYHLAAMISVVESVEKPELCDQINRVASEYIVDLCAEKKIKFVYASSAAVYGNQSASLIMESMHPRPISPYGQSKLAVERYCRLKKKQFGLSYVCLRKFNVYGMGQNANSAYASAIPKFFKSATEHATITLYGEGVASRDFIHVEDVVSAYVAVASKNVNGIFNVATGKGTSVRSIADMIISQTNSKSKITLKPLRDGEIMHSAGSARALMSATGWKPLISVSDAIVAMSVQRDFTNPNAKPIRPQKRLLVAMPAYNEGPVIGGVVKHLKECGFDNVLVVDDCAKDNTASEARLSGATVVSHIINRGAGAATATAIAYAKLHNFDFLCMMDADGQHNPRDIEPLLLWAQRYDVVIGSRNVGDTQMPLLRKIANTVGSFVTFAFFGVYARDSQTGFRLLSRRAIESIQLKADRFEFASEMFGEIHAKKLSWTEAPITVIYTNHSKNKGQSIPNGFRMIARFLLKN